MTPTTNSQNLRIRTLAVLLLAALALAVNLNDLGADSFWGEEIFTASFASLPPLEVIRWTAGDIHPPLYYLISGSFAKLLVPFGQTDGPNVATDWLWRFPHATRCWPPRKETSSAYGTSKPALVNRL